MKTNNNGYEIIVGIPSFMEADSISFVTQQVDKGLAKYYPDMKSIIVNMDNNSEDNTKDAFLNTETTITKKYITTPKGVRGKGNNLLNLFKFAKKNISTLKAAIVVDADLKSINPEWIKYLGQAILDGHDFAVPRYSRHQFDGSITNHICYPLLYGLIGEDIRQPIGGEFAFAPNLIEYWLDQKWVPTTRQYGIDIFMSCNAIIGQFKICEVVLGAKIHKASAPKLGPMFTQVVTTFFEMILSRQSEWISIPVVTPAVKKRIGYKKLDPPQKLDIDILGLKQNLRNEYISRIPLLRKYLNDYSILRLEKMYKEDFYNIDILLWTQVIYQLLFAFDMGSKKDRRDIVEVIKPIYFARSVTFDYLTWRYSTEYAEEAILEQAKAFAAQKPYLLGLYLNSVANKQFNAQLK